MASKRERSGRILEYLLVALITGFITAVATISIVSDDNLVSLINTKNGKILSLEATVQQANDRAEACEEKFDRYVRANDYLKSKDTNEETN